VTEVSTVPTPEAFAELVIPAVTGYDPQVSYLAARYKQGGRTVYSINLSPAQILAFVNKPDPTKRTLGNREIRLQHAIDFGKYVRAYDGWVSPALILRAPAIFEFEAITGPLGAELGVVKFPRQASSDIHILDGQHRILGFYYATQGIADDLDKARASLAAARRLDPEGRSVLDAQQRIAELERQRTRLEKESATLLVYVEEDADTYKQMFFDIAENALGITASIKAGFDSRKVVNRALDQVSEHGLLHGRVDPEKDRIGRGSPYLLGAKHVSEITRTIAVGLDGRVSKNQEVILREKDVAANTEQFLTMLEKTFPDLTRVAAAELMPDDLRGSSLLGSVLMLRVLAGAYYELITRRGWKPSDVAKFYETLAPHMNAPVGADSIWMTETGVFALQSSGPRGRRQDLKALRDSIVDWAIASPPFLG
jgi:hypothetical protein